MAVKVMALCASNSISVCTVSVYVRVCVRSSHGVLKHYISGALQMDMHITHFNYTVIYNIHQISLMKFIKQFLIQDMRCIVLE